MLATVALVLIVAGGGSEDVQQTAGRVLELQDYQRRLPDVGSPHAPARRGAPRAGSPGAPAPPALRPPPQLVWLVFLAVGASLLVWALRNLHRAPRPVPVVPAASGSGQASARPERRARRPATLDDAEWLAAQGRFAEAVHALALSALARLAPAPALTAREVLRQAELHDEARGPLGALVSAAERVQFAAGTVGAEEFERCRGHFSRFRNVFGAVRA